MRTKLIRFCMMLVLAGSLLSAQQAVYAQDTGPPALRQLAFYTVGGSAGGALLGVAIWMLDPLAPEADIRLNALSGMGVGSVLGFIFGIMQLNRQAVFPYEEPAIPGDDIGGLFPGAQPSDPLSIRFSRDRRDSNRPEVPILNFHIRF